jgi:hypothetical protein
MVQARKPGRLRPRAKTLPESLREFLTPAVWKQARNAAPRRKMPRWKVQPLLLVALTMTWCCGDSLSEKFEAARGFYVICHEKRRRPGATFEGFRQALEKLPMPVLRALARGIRGRIERCLGDRWRIGGFIPLGCDGSRLECPRSVELEQRLGVGGKADSAPTVWVTAIVHLLTGVPWSWRFGKGGKASERNHLVQMLKDLPDRAALIVADAGYYGYDLLRELIGARVWFLIRMSSNVTLYTKNKTPLSKFREGKVYYWTDKAQKLGLAPVEARLLRVRDQKRKIDVWLLTNVMSPKQLSLADANRFYRWRWENEGYFRTYKRTLAKMKLLTRTLRQVHREAEVSMIATQLLLAQGTQAQPLPKASQEEPRVMCSPRKVLLEVRREIAGRRGTRGRGLFCQRLATCGRDRRTRQSAKATRSWPRRKDHTPPGPPKILTLNAAQEIVISRSQMVTSRQIR